MREKIVLFWNAYIAKKALIIDSIRGSAVGAFLNWKVLSTAILVIGLPVGLYLSQHAAIFTQRAAPSTEEILKQETTQMVGLIAQPQSASSGIQMRGLAQQVLTTLAIERKLHMQKLMLTNPQALIDNAISQKQRDALPDNIKENVEEHVTIQGEYIMSHQDDFVDGKVTNTYTIINNTEKLTLHTDGDISSINSGSQVKVNGIKLDNNIAVSNKLQANLQVTQKANPSSPRGVKRVAVVLGYFTDAPKGDETLDAVKQSFFGTAAAGQPTSVNEFLKASSNGQLSITGDVFGWYPLNISTAGCNDMYYYNGSQGRAKGWGDYAAYFLKKDKGIDVNSYDYVVFAYPALPSCPNLSGSAQGVPTKYMSIVGVDKKYNINYRIIVEHEFGHALGIWHASGYYCTDGSKQVAISNNCQPAINDDHTSAKNYEYSDPFDVMGSGYPNTATQYSNYHKALLGWQVGTQDITKNGIYSLNPIEHNSSTVALRVAKQDSKNFYFYYLEYRQSDKLFDTLSDPKYNPDLSGIIIRLARSIHDGSQRSVLIDTTPGSANGFYDAPLGYNKIYYDPYAKINIGDIAVGGATAQVGVVFGDKLNSIKDMMAIIGKSSSPAPTQTPINTCAQVGLSCLTAACNINQNDVTGNTIRGKVMKCDLHNRQVCCQAKPSCASQNGYCVGVGHVCRSGYKPAGDNIAECTPVSGSDGSCCLPAANPCSNHGGTSRSYGQCAQSTPGCVQNFARGQLVSVYACNDGSYQCPSASANGSCH